MASDKYSYMEGGFHYENLKSFLETGKCAPSKSDKPNPQYELNKDFVDMIVAISEYDNVQLKLLEPLATAFGVSAKLVQKYYRAYRCMQGWEVSELDKKKASVGEREYSQIVSELGQLREKCERLVESEKYYMSETSRLRSELIKEKNNSAEYLSDLRKAIKEIGTKRWNEL